MTEQLSIVADPQKRVASTPSELKGLREAAGLSIPGTAAQLRLAARQVEALELGEWDKLPGIAFIKGALRSYGRLLSADLGPLIAHVDQQLGRSELKADRTLEGKIPERSALGFGEGGKGHKWAWFGLALIGVAAVALFFGQGLDSYIPKQFIPPSKTMDLGRDAGSAATASIPLPSAPSVTNPPAATSGKLSSHPSEAPSAAMSGADPSKSASNSSVAPAAEPAGATAGVTPAIGSAPDRTKASVPNSTNAGGVVPGEVQYHISFAKDSWVDIKDAGGERVLYGTQVAGTNLVLKGKAPYSAVIGNAIHVRIEKKDGSTGASSVEQIVPMPKDTRQGIARLTIR
jgi:cytoskeleton protein RodZ